MPLLQLCVAPYKWQRRTPGNVDEMYAHVMGSAMLISEWVNATNGHSGDIFFMPEPENDDLWIDGLKVRLEINEYSHGGPDRDLRITLTRKTSGNFSQRETHRFRAGDVVEALWMCYGGRSGKDQQESQQ